MAVRVRITSIPLMFLLLCSALLATTLQGVQGEVEVDGPSESECRPYIEKALKKLETGDTQSADVQDDDDGITHIVTTDDSDTQSGEAIESIEPKSVEEDTQEVEDEQDASEKETGETESVEVETANDEGDADETGDTQEVSGEDTAEEKNESELAETASEEKEGETEETAESAEKEASVEDEQEASVEKEETEEKDDGTEEQKSTEEGEDAGEASVEEGTASAEQADEAASEEHEDTASVEQGAASVEEVASSVEEGAESAEQEQGDEAASAEHEDAASEEQEGTASVEVAASDEQEDAGASAEQDEGAPGTEEATASTEQDEGAASVEDAAASVEEGAASVEDAAASVEEGVASTEQEDGAASTEQEATSAEQEEVAASAEQEEGATSAEQETDASAEQQEAAASAEQEDATSAEQEAAASAEQEGASSAEEQTEGSEEKPEASTEKDEASAEQADVASAEAGKDEASPEKDGSAEQADEAASVEKDASNEKEPSGEKEESREKADEDKTKEEASAEAEAEGDADSKQESAEKDKADEEADSKEGIEEESEEGETETTPEEDLTWEVEIPTELRPREHLNEILNLNEESSVTDSMILKAADKTLNELKKIYENAIKPLETLYKYRDLSNRHFGDPEIFSKPLVLFMGPWSGGKSSIINYLVDNEYTQTSLRTGAEPSPAYFNLLMWGEEPEVLDGTQLAADWTFSGLQKFGQGLEERLRGLKLPNKLLENINIVEIPGILEVRKQVSRVFPFNDACQWFIDRADIIFLVYDPSKLDVGPETEAILDQLKGREYQTRIILNKADQVKPEELMRVQGALIWNISPLMSSAQPPVMYSASLWSKPYEVGAPVRLLQAQERALLKDLKTAIDKRIENKIASARRFAVRVRNHAKMVDCYLTTYYNHKSVFGNKKLVSDQIIEHPQDYHIYEGLSTLTNISRYDLPDPDVYRDFFRLNPLYDFQQLSATCTYFRGCPINRLDVAIAYDLPELVGKYKKMVEPATNNNADSSTKS